MPAFLALLLFFTLPILTGPAMTPAWAGDKLIVVSAVCVHTPEITLAQIARAEGPEAQLFLDIRGSEPLLAAPKFDGARATLHGGKLRDLIMHRLGPDLPFLAVPDQIQVQRGGQVLHGLALRPEIDKTLTHALAQYDGDVEIRDHRLPDYLFLAETTPVQIRVRPTGIVTPGRISLRLDAIAEDGRTVQSFTGTVFADVWKTVPCAARVLNRGNVLEPSLVTFARKNLAYLTRSPWNGQGLPLRMAAPVGEGQVITVEAVEMIPVVAKGKQLTLIYNGQTLTLSVPAESMEDGSIGSVIKVRNTQTRKVIHARVLDANTVQTL